MKKLGSMLVVCVCVLSLLGLQSFAAQNLEGITFEDGNFSVGIHSMETVRYEVRGLIKEGSTLKKVDISNPQDIIWKSLNERVVRIQRVDGNVATVRGMQKGQATIIATYNGMKVESHISVREETQNVSVKNIHVEVKFPSKDRLQNPQQISDNELLKNIDVNIKNLPNFSLKDIYGSNYNDSGVLKSKVTALQGLLYALETKCDPEGISDGWDWVRENVDIGYNGSFVSRVGVYKNYGITGWMYKVNDVLPMVALSQYELKDGDHEVWGFASWGEEW